MSARPSTPLPWTRPPTLLLWFGTLGGAGAWAVQFVANLYFTWAQCNVPAPRWDLPVHTWQIGLSVAALVVGLGSTAVTAQIFRATLIDDIDGQNRRGDGAAPPVGRVHFLAGIGLIVNFVTLSIIVLTGVGAPLLTVCQQS